MKIRILDAAQQDLVSGFRFYDLQEAGLGSYFLDSLFADIKLLLSIAACLINFQFSFAAETFMQ